MITKEEVYEKVDRYLALNVGHLVAPSEPVFDEEKNIWTVSLKYKSNFASFFLDTIVANVKGEFIYVPTRERLCELVNQKLENKITFKIELKTEDNFNEVKKFIEKMKPEAVV